MTEHTYEIWQRDIMVVSVTADNLDEARREILHYLVQYGQDGPCSIRGADMEAFMAGIKDNPPHSGQPKANIRDLIRSKSNASAIGGGTCGHGTPLAWHCEKCADAGS